MKTILIARKKIKLILILAQDNGPYPQGVRGRVFPIMTYHGKVNPERSTFSAFRYALVWWLTGICTVFKQARERWGN